MKTTIKIIAFTLALFVFAVMAVILRNHFLDKGILSHKDEQYDPALKFLKPIALLGESEAQSILGECYAFGHGVNKNSETAMYWFRRSASKKNCSGDQCIAADLFFVGEKYIEGIGVEVDPKEALVWIKMAADNGYPKAVEYLFRNVSILDPNFRTIV